MSRMSEVNCNRCKRQIKTLKGDVLKCFLCQKYFHDECEEPNFGVVIREALKNCSGMRWACKDCEKDTAISESAVKNQSTCKCEEKINKRIDALERTMKALLEGERTQTQNEPPQQRELTWAKVVTIMPKNRKVKEKSNVKEKVRRSIDPATIKATEMRETIQGGVKFKCAANDNNNLEKEIKGKLGPNYDITISDQRRPKVMIVGMYDDKNLKSDVLERIIKKQNESLVGENDYLKIVKVSTGRTNVNVKKLIAEVDKETYDRLMEAGRLCIHWSRCKVLDGVDIMRCYNCSRYSHKGSVCSQEKCCPKCMGNHTLTEHSREEEEEKCINCHEANEKWNLGLITNHAVWSRNCEVYKRKLNAVKNSFKP